MKLIDLLVQELPKRGGWPVNAVECQRFVDESTIDFYDAAGNWPQDCGKVYGPIAHQLVRKQNHACELETVTRDQYEAARAAAQQPAWNGEGLPPIGCECEWKASCDHDWRTVKVLAYDGKDAWLKPLSGSQSFVVGNVAGFRPIRTEAERKREELIRCMSHSLRANGSINDEQLERLYSDIAAGNIPGVKLEDAQ